MTDQQTYRHTEIRVLWEVSNNEEVSSRLSRAERGYFSFIILTYIHMYPLSMKGVFSLRVEVDFRDILLKKSVLTAENDRERRRRNIWKAEEKKVSDLY